jgi:hypothetical protein
MKMFIVFLRSNVDGGQMGEQNEKEKEREREIGEFLTVLCGDN